MVEKPHSAVAASWAALGRTRVSAQPKTNSNWTPAAQSFLLAWTQKYGTGGVTHAGLIPHMTPATPRNEAVKKKREKRRREKVFHHVAYLTKFGDDSSVSMPPRDDDSL